MVVFVVGQLTDIVEPVGGQAICRPPAGHADEPRVGGRLNLASTLRPGCPVTGSSSGPGRARGGTLLPEGRERKAFDRSDTGSPPQRGRHPPAVACVPEVG